ncbi:hypothetical protein NLX85_18125 [Micromonospora sp. A3M-1-15]|uniref:hypothetical protein n=1 Tax=Micromonospora sp. A3M-1-15 TaxID=2962035 RepID=UPI0020B7DEB0|nr:hypothetical protein [Micromonospora sp. A3M-1-15]MCP3785285.1 hypothetical protein [Micromonospora sp. A3M-1-15]
MAAYHVLGNETRRRQYDRYNSPAAADSRGGWGAPANSWYDSHDDGARWVDTDAFYDAQQPPSVDWQSLAKGIKDGQLTNGGFTLPWWMAERSSRTRLSGVWHNEARIRKLSSAPPDGIDDEGIPWYVGVLYPGLPDEYSDDIIGVMTKAGHVGCLPSSLSCGGLGQLVRDSASPFKLVCVPVVFGASGDAHLPLPIGTDFGAFNYPWGADGQEVSCRFKINRSHLLALHMRRHGLTHEWAQVAATLCLLHEASGVSVLEPLNVSGLYRVYDSVRHRRSEASQQIFDAICEAAGVVVTEEFDTDVDAVIVRRADSETRACRTARDRRIPLFRSDEFTGRIAEAMVSRFVEPRQTRQNAARSVNVGSANASSMPVRGGARRVLLGSGLANPHHGAAGAP